VRHTYTHARLILLVQAKYALIAVLAFFVLVNREEG
jgi:hypothetical protein